MAGKGYLFMRRFEVVCCSIMARHDTVSGGRVEERRSNDEGSNDG